MTQTLEETTKYLRVQGSPIRHPGNADTLITKCGIAHKDMIVMTVTTNDRLPICWSCRNPTDAEIAAAKKNEKLIAKETAKHINGTETTDQPPTANAKKKFGAHVNESTPNSELSLFSI